MQTYNKTINTATLFAIFSLLRQLYLPYLAYYGIFTYHIWLIMVSLLVTFSLLWYTPSTYGSLRNKSGNLETIFCTPMSQKTQA